MERVSMTHKWSIKNCPKDIESQVLSVIGLIDKKGSASDMDLCKIFGEVLWSDGKYFNSHAFRFLFDHETLSCEVTKRHLH